MQAKENHQEFIIPKENILPVIQQTKPNQLKNALQPNKGLINTNIQPNIKSNFQENKLNQVKQGIQNKINVQKDGTNKNRQSLKPITKQNDNGKIKKANTKVNSASKLNSRKIKKTTQAKDENKESTKLANNAKSNTDKLNTAKPAKKENELDFVIFCDENDELAVKAVEKESNEQKNKAAEKKKGLAERNLKQNTTKINQQINQVNEQKINLECHEKIAKLQIQQTTQTEQQIIESKIQTEQQIVQQTVQIIKNNIQKSLNSNIELIKDAVVPINNLTLDETISLSECTINTINETTIENKENDPTLMSIDLTKDDDFEIQNVDQFRDVSGDMVCREFSNEIYLYMLERESKFLPDQDYMAKQPEINSKMRAMLVDWLIDVGIEYELGNETVFLTISYIDQFLSSLTISLQNFQLLGTAALFIASKYEEIYPPELKDFIFVTDDAYTKLQMLSMERVILKALNFQISPPTTFYFLKYFLTKLSLPIYAQHFAEYLCFLSLLHPWKFDSILPSDIAISAIIMTLHTYTLTDLVNLDDFKQLTKIHFHKNKEGKLSDEVAIKLRQSNVNEMFLLHKEAADDTQQAVFLKYSSEKYLSVATVDAPEEIPDVKNFFY